MVCFCACRQRSRTTVSTRRRSRSLRTSSSITRICRPRHRRLQHCPPYRPCPSEGELLVLRPRPRSKASPYRLCCTSSGAFSSPVADPAVVVVLVPLGPEILFRPNPPREPSRRRARDERAAASHAGRRRPGPVSLGRKAAPGGRRVRPRSPLYRTRAPRAALCCDSVESKRETRTASLRGSDDWSRKRGLRWTGTSRALRARVVARVPVRDVRVGFVTLSFYLRCDTRGFSP